MMMDRFKKWQYVNHWWGNGMYDLAVVTWRLGHPWASLTCWFESVIYHHHLTSLGLQYVVGFIRHHTVPKQVWSEAQEAINKLARERKSGKA